MCGIPPIPARCLRLWGLDYARAIGFPFLVLLVPITAAFLWRIRVEERALNDALGDDYGRYAARTKRLVPVVY